ncbi:SDR family NAD(P)-dependent oxidoreductase [Capillimicrobium parvum]|uniref:2,5-dichloro-2,5-cyclohexadiene-1,4-diol dehydrogenase n=1 Tax=Capillimicrobium parvum TaxID=2884022 RepID=A0A9E6XYN8_9ACTN|nr:SDR family oxidoreductase [Capillimicrobium parvum]UGS36954.1 2,5-dichloro-2,5-cyclohexadiene-1,4-diol dehydrogenase [Capillimicrobium parvum]
MGILDDKVVLITGAASGIGEATAREARAEGARLLLSDVDEARGTALAQELGGATFVACDVTDESQVEELVATAQRELGGLDGAFNCAGILGTIGMTADTSFEDFKRICDVDLNGVFLCTKHELRAMLADGGGSIVNMASAAGLIGWPGAVGYVAAKHGVVGLTKAAALEYATEGIRVNSVCPSYTETPMVSDLFENLLGGDAAAVEAARANHPIGRFAQAPEIASACVWLLSDKASFVTGTAMSVDGGYTAP